MTAGEVMVRHLRTAAGGATAVLIDDPHGLLRLPAEIRTRDDLRPLTVVTATGNLSFRRRLEALGEQELRLCVVRQRAEVYLPDIEAVVNAGGLRLQASPSGILSLATGDRWPVWVDGEAELVAGRLAAIVQARRRFRHVSDTPLDDGDVERLLLHGLLGCDIDEPNDVADAWLAVCRELPSIGRLHQRGSRLAARLTAWLARQRAPLRWVKLTDPSAAVRLTWLVAVLLPHLPDLAALLPRVYPGARLLEGEDPTAIARVAYRCERRSAELASEQCAAAEGVIAGPLRDGVVRFLRLRDPAGAIELLRREERSGLLVIMALRTLLGAVAADQPLDTARLLPPLDALATRLDSLTLRDAVAAHLDLLRAVLRLEAVRRRLAEAGDEPGDPVGLFVDSGADGLDGDLAVARAALCDNALAVTDWDPVPDPERHKAVVAGLFHLVQMTEQAGLRLEAAADPSPGGDVPTAWDDYLAPALEARGQPRATLLLVGGLGWAGWRQVAAVAGRRYDVAARPLVAALPAAAEVSLRKAIAGAAWRPELATTGWEALFSLARPELRLRRGRAPQALEPLRAAGLVRWQRTSRERCLAVIDLFAGAPGGLSPGEYQRRVGLLAAALAALAESGRRDELVALLGVSGAARTTSAAGLALPGQAYGARAMVTDAAADEALRLDPREVGLPAAPGERLLVATGRHRLAPCAAGTVMADGGATLAERIVPFALLTPHAGAGGAELAVGTLLAPEQVNAGEPFEVGLWVTLTGGALAEEASLHLGGPTPAVCGVTLDLDEPRWLGLEVTLPAGEHTLEVELRAGRRLLRRRASCRAVEETRLADESEARSRTREPAG